MQPDLSLLEIKNKTKAKAYESLNRTISELEKITEKSSTPIDEKMKAFKMIADISLVLIKCD